MKLRLTVLSLAAGLAALTAVAQNTPPPAAPPATPAPPAAPPAVPAPPGAQPAPGRPGGDLIPPAEPPEPPDNFKTENERLSYAVAAYLATNEKRAISATGGAQPALDEVAAGVKDVLSGGKSLDYALGVSLAMQLRRVDLETDSEAFIAGVRDILGAQQPKLTQQQQQMALQRVNTVIRTRMDAKALKATTEFLGANAKNEGVKTTPSGLQYKIEKEGDGKTAGENDLVTINYKAMQMDGTEYEKNPPSGPARKAVRTLPKGLQEGLTILKSGGKAKFWIPPVLGWGEQGRPPVRGNSVIIYEVEFLGVEPLPKPAPATGNVNAPRGPITAVTPPITVEIPPKPGEKPAEPPKTPPGPPPAPPTPPPAPPAPPPPGNK